MSCVNNHKIHRHCARKWFEKDKTCPSCRGPFPDDDDDDDDIDDELESD